MAGERLALHRFVEISAVCTRAEFRGRGYARSLVSLIAAKILEVGKVPFLHVKTENEARFVYQRIGFNVRKPMHVTIVKKI
ncbi:GNAT family N-acetyltransferase [Rhizobium leguminosarum bv. viciae]|nr:GNAT family N-acetyltransferase [Rhizobium leguminosarum bv. viciae]